MNNNNHFISTALDRYPGAPEEDAQDIFVANTCYRRMDPRYFAWLRRRMESAKRRFEAGKLPAQTWEEMRTRFNELQNWATGHFGKAVLLTELRQFNPTLYEPPHNHDPEPFQFPETGDWPCGHPVTRDAVAKVGAIREKAHAFGWSEASLYQNRGSFTFPCGQDWGLVCFLNEDTELGAITATHIEIIHHNHGRQHTLRFARRGAGSPPSIR